MQCERNDGVFSLRAVLFKPVEVRSQKKKAPKKTAIHTLMTVLLGLFLLNCMPDMAQALETVPGSWLRDRLVDLRTYSWGDTSFTAELPVLEEESVAEVEDTQAQPSQTEDSAPSLDTESQPTASAEVGDMNEQMEEYIAKVQENFLWYVARKYHGYVASDTEYQVLRDDDEMLSLCFYTTINAGGSGEYSRCFTLDKRTGQVLNLSDLFVEGSDYVEVISADILRQMTEQVEAGEGDYFIPGGIWSEEECFKSIDADQNFYLDEANRLVILFDEYEVAPGSMGAPRFVIDEQAIAGILAL